MGEVPGFPVVVVALVEQPGSAVLILKKVWVARFARVPAAWVTVGKEGLVGQPLPSDAVVAFGDANLLRIVVICASIEHVEGVVFPHDGGAFHALAFPGIFGLQDGRICELGPLVAIEVGEQGCSCYALHLDSVGGIAGSEIEQISVAHGEYFRIDGSAAVPVACWAEDWVGGIAPEIDAVVGQGMTDGVFATVPVRLIK